nr:histidine kinase N-terminal 7TM domain-containing protein [Pararhodobacter sp. SW119]
MNPPLPIDTVAAVFLTGLAAIAVWLGWNRRFHGKPFFIASLIGAIFWLGAVTLEHRVIGEACKIRWAQVAWLGIAFLPVALCFFVDDYARARNRWRSRRRRLALLGGPIVIGAMAATNDWHGAFYGPETGIDPRDPTGQVHYDHGPLFMLAALWLYGFIVSGVALLVRGLLRTHPAHRPFFAAWLIILITPIAANLGYIFARFTVSGIDPTAYAYALAMMIFAWFVITDRMLDLRAVATEVLFLNTPGPILIVTPDGGVAGANPAALALATDAGDARHLKDWPELAPHLKSLLQPDTLPMRTFALGNRRYDLRILPMEKPLDSRAEMGRVLVFNDVTERESLEARLAAERDYLQLLMQTTMTAIIAFDEGGCAIFANPEAGKLTRISARELLGMDHAAIFPPVPLDDQLPEGGFGEILAAGTRLRGVQLAFRRADGAVRMLSVNVARIDRDGVGTRVVCAMADMTEQLETARSLKAARDRAEAANRTKSQFLANMSHEIRTPLNGVLGMAEVLEDALDEPGTRAMARTIRDSGATLLSILNDILDMSKIEAGKMQIESVAFDPAQIATRIRALHATAARDKGLAFEVAGPDPASPARQGDPHRILQVVHNIVGNAIKFTETGGVHVRFDAARGAPIRIAVRDTGIGMTPEQADRVFTEFEQGDGTVARRFGGTGLGMTITKALVEQMKGDIALDTEPVRGTCIIVTLPLDEVEAAPTTAPHDTPRASASDDPAAPLAGLTILAADDNAVNRRVLGLMLERAGARVTMVEGGEAARALWAPEEFALVLLDISMPDLDGFSTLAALRTKAADLGVPAPVALAITANVMTHQVDEYFRAGFAGHVGKPFQSTRLIEEISRVTRPAAAARPGGVPSAAAQ